MEGRSKRKTTEENSLWNIRKRVALVAPRNRDVAIGTAMSIAAPSPFLRLSSEIRYQTYGEVLGDCFIHLKHLRHTCYPDMPWLQDDLFWDGNRYSTANKKSFGTGDRWLQFVCAKDGPKSEEELRYVGMTEEPWPFVWRIASGKLPIDCPAWQRCDGTKPDRVEVYDRETHLEILRTCRQIYDEASPIL